MLLPSPLLNLPPAAADTRTEQYASHDILRKSTIILHMRSQSSMLAVVVLIYGLAEADQVDVHAQRMQPA